MYDNLVISENNKYKIREASYRQDRHTAENDRLLPRAYVANNNDNNNNNMESMLMYKSATM